MAGVEVEADVAGEVHQLAPGGKGRRRGGRRARPPPLALGPLLWQSPGHPPLGRPAPSGVREPKKGPITHGEGLYLPLVG